ncbi:hypothetical protein EAE96_010305 [Botrytis aclada]|nr:hypothetical protein EAE96_010305 [Botrytis aclada]
MTTNSKLKELALLILSHTSQIDDYLIAESLPAPSFDVDAPIEMKLPPHLAQSREILLNAVEDIHAHVAGPLPYLMRLTSPTINVWMSIQAINQFKIAESFPVGSQTTFAHISEYCGLPESDVRRLLRLAIAHRIFKELDNGLVEHTAISRLLLEYLPVRQWTQLVFQEMWPSSSRVVDAMLRWPQSEEPEHTGFALANNITAGAKFFDVIGNSQERSKRFADAMSFMQSAPPFSPIHLIQSLEWTQEESPKLMVDVGGSHGSIAIEILRNFPSIKCIVQDLGEVIAGAKIPEDLRNRLKFQKHNFFDEQDVLGADAYFFRSIFHDWSDKYAMKILSNLIPALRTGSIILLNEVCLPPPGVLPLYHDQLLRGYDLAMKQNFNGKERDFDDWTRLFKSASPHFRILGVKSPQNSMLSLIEVTWDGPSSFNIESNYFSKN